MEIAAVIFDQAKKLVSCSNLFYSLPQLELAEILSKAVGKGRWFFGNSGAEAVEAALKVARRYGILTGKRKIVTLKGSFHGRTFGAMTATGQEKIKKEFGELLPDFAYVSLNDLDGIDREIDNETAAILVEIIQGESSVRMVSSEFLERAFELSRKKGALFMVDEIQTGLGRTGGTFLACKKRGLDPDVVTLAKGLANGLPIGAIWIKDELSELFHAGDHGSTYGGNALVCKVAVEVVKRIIAEGYLESNLKKGAYFMHLLFEKLAKNDKVKEIRGEGLMVAVEFKEPIAEKVISLLIERGILAGKGGDFTLRFLPPYIAQNEHFEQVGEILSEVVEEVDD
jgi:acetylornithine/succinyldiaminopimelate/putrescine aminotransferase